MPELLKEFINQTIQVTKYDSENVEIRLQEYNSDDGGFTDIEIICEPYFYIIIEAKRGWVLPGKEQLEKYASRQNFFDSSAKVKKLIAMSECSKSYAEHNLQVKNIKGIDIIPVSWKDVYKYSEAAYRRSNHAEKHLLIELQTYLGGLMTMQNKDSNLVFVVSLGSSKIEGSDLTWIDVVEKKERYFHPMGQNGWPKTPPNYIAFRYHGKLQSIHHIEGYKVLTDLSSRIPEIPYASWMETPHFLYKLGKGFAPSKEVKTGNIYRNGRVWCMLDTLFTCDTISDARDETKRRQQLIGSKI
ncbi:hypothetical protein [Ruminiclostridium josui]|uniref:hypothetical protein n=1 Tax=Ruminiclostridium josui TaxID=1499 RepID=UPI000AAF22C7|nr:hypothetical protein [Ruminiclostridium josui]